MKKKTTNLLTQIALIFVSWALSVAPASAQNAAISQSGTNAVKTDSKMLYHGGRFERAYKTFISSFTAVGPMHVGYRATPQR